MKYKLFNTSPQIGSSILGTVLKNRNIFDLQTMLNVPSSVQLHHSKLKNMDIAVKAIIEAITFKKIIGILVDCDVDGYTSSASIYRYITGICPDVDIRVLFHEGKKHGLSDDVFMNIRESDIEFLIIPDAGSGDYERLEILHDDGVEVVVIDHHECDHESEHAIVVNNQLSPQYTNKNLSGVGVVYKLCKAMDEVLNINYADNILDLVALGNVADGMSMYELETRHLVQEGMNKINNTLLQAIIYKQSYSMGGKINITTMGWNVAPMLNAVIRMGTMQDKIDLFEGFVSTDVDFCTDIVNKCLSIQRKQNAEVKKAIPQIINIIEQESLNNNKAIIVNATGIIQGELIGLVANKLLSHYKKPILLLHEVDGNEKMLGGSARSPREIFFKRLCNETEEFSFCEGHGAAFGCQILKDNVSAATEKLNEKLKDFTPSDEKTYDVDAVINYPMLNINDVTTIGDLSELWGNGINEPLFVIKNIKVNTKDIKLMGKNNTIKVTLDKLDCMKFFTNRADYEAMTMVGENPSDKYISMDIVCKFKTNEWQGKKKPQLEIIDYTVKEDRLAFF